MTTRFFKLAILFILFLPPFFIFSDSYAQGLDDSAPVVRAVLFYSPTCGHCQKVISVDLPPIYDEYGDQLQIIGIDVSTENGLELYLTYVELWEREGVPALVIGDINLVGSQEIPEQFPDIIEKVLENGGTDWPEIPGLGETLEQIKDHSPEPISEDDVLVETTTESLVSNTESEVPTEGINLEDESPTNTDVKSQAEEVSTASTNLTIAFDDEITVGDRFRQDIIANSIAVIVLLAMTVSVIWILISVFRTSTIEGRDWSQTIPILSVLGLIVAGYLTFVEVTQAEAICGPIGNCNSVQQSPYALLFGFLHVGILGLLGYFAILFGWILKKYGRETWQNSLTILIWGMALFGVIFSIYLTYLEPFVIGATCMWCIASAIIITLQFWASSEPLRRMWMVSDDDLDDG
jgi:uncharacterized membrane protein/thiol-disulfide isomerase/thioredoxin